LLQSGQPTLLLIGLPTSSPPLAQQLETGASQPGLLVLVDPDELDRVLPPGWAGATGWVSQDDQAANLASVVIAARRGEMTLPPAMAARALRQGKSGMDALIEPLSERELEVLRLLAQGLTNKDIAQTLCLSVLTVKTHLHHIFGKLGVHSRTEAALWATQRGYGRAE
jgi:DNA-binding NarL/FixJ family response regulator